ncbi:hypothetical protein [Candidatus Mycoplasma haematohominis]|uniref:Uncharacterized protein n=1 Tax=Candidatus Mycoplasma haematohominis TaxID=1494318 RepID=A0A478FTC9_9MOLU|nr:hypothetical protein [Candidatus Mycoplasma haemohominis]GCE63739.1 hypothetical protein MHSWG343_07390 [Candidatus Mycoplasma haemohominis]
MSTQTIAAAVAGTAVIGGGGATIAYAAGAFDAKYSDFDDYVKNGGKYRYIGSSGTDRSLTEDKIKAHLKDTNKGDSYRTALTGKIDNMNLTGTSNPSKPNASEIGQAGKEASGTTTNLDKVAKFVNQWCEVTKVKKPANAQAGDKFRVSDLEAVSEWNAFVSVCVEEIN